MPTEEDDYVTQRRTRIATETTPVRDLSPAQGEVPVPGPRSGRPPAHPLLRLLPVPAGSAPRTVPRGPRGAPVSVPPAPDASTDRPSSGHARPPGDTEHDGATEAGDPTIRVTSSWLTEAAGSVHQRHDYPWRCCTNRHWPARCQPTGSHLPIRYDTGRPRAIIRLRIAQPRTASLPCPAGLRARRPSPMMDL